MTNHLLNHPPKEPWSKSSTSFWTTLKSTPKNKPTFGIEGVWSRFSSIVDRQHNGVVKVFRIDLDNAETQYGTTNDVEMEELTRRVYGELLWTIREYQRGWKQHNHIEQVQVRKAKAI
ncbi:MAG: hypothetical protein ACFCD0_28340 [Gemmataceae bacterium]